MILCKKKIFYRSQLYIENLNITVKQLNLTYYYSIFNGHNIILYILYTSLDILQSVVIVNTFLKHEKYEDKQLII